MSSLPDPLPPDFSHEDVYPIDLQDRELIPSRCGTVEFDPIIHPEEWATEPPAQIQDAGTLQWMSRTHIRAATVSDCAQHEAAGVMAETWGNGGLVPVLCSGIESRVSFGRFYLDPDTGALTAYIGFDAPASYMAIYNSGYAGVAQ